MARTRHYVLTRCSSIVIGYDNDRNRHAIQQVPDLHPQGRPRRAAWKAGQEFVFIPKGEGVLVMPVPGTEAIGRIAKGAKTTSYRERRTPLLMRVNTSA
ncbi:hypothetical protein [Rhodanobacter lindaniclasticus]